MNMNHSFMSDVEDMVANVYDEPGMEGIRDLPPLGIGEGGDVAIKCTQPAHPPTQCGMKRVRGWAAWVGWGGWGGWVDGDGSLGG